MAITKREALSVVYQCAHKYKSELMNHSLLFICTDKHKHTYAIEVTFDASNFLHLTGFQTREQGISAGDFFRRCIDRRLSENDFDFAADGTTPLKLDVLPKLVSKNLSANMIGDYNGLQPKLYTEKLAGNVVGCMGFISAFVPAIISAEMLEAVQEERQRRSNIVTDEAGTHRKKVRYCSAKVKGAENGNI